MEGSNGVSIKINNLSFSFFNSDGKKLRVLQNISDEILPGSITTIVGPSGCGKTTLLNIISGLIDFESNEVEVEGQVEIGALSPQHARLKKHFGVCFQRPSLFPWRSVEGNIELPLALNGFSKSERKKIVGDLLGVVRMKDYQNAKISELSGGMQHRVALARSIALQPPVLIMDEPFAAIDEELREELNVEFLRIWKHTGSTILFVTHNLSEAILLGSKIIVLTKRPASIKEIIDVNLPERAPSIVTSEIFTNLLTKVRSAVRNKN